MRIFISHNHKDKDVANRLKDELRAAGFSVTIDTEAMFPGEDIKVFIERSIRDSDFTLSLVSSNSLPSSWVGMESILTFNGEKVADKGFIPVFIDDSFFRRTFTDEIFDALDVEINGIQDTIGKRLSKDRGINDLQNELRRYRNLRNSLDEIIQRLRESLSIDIREENFQRGLDKILEHFRQKANTARTTNKEVVKPPPTISPDRLPTAEDAALFGRDRELALLDAAWQDPHTHLVEFIAWGGVGKTALVREWLNRLALRDYDGAARVYTWSFYSQGASDQRQSSAEPFIVDILKWFGEDETALPTSPQERAKKLSAHLRAQPTLLILDGLEPLQHPLGQQEGQLKDQGLRLLLRDLAAQNPGLCLLTSRIAVADIAGWQGKTLIHHPLENLTKEAGADLLAHLGVTGPRKELEQAAADFKGHSLALRLLGNYLKALHKGDVRRRDRIQKLTAEEKKGGHARRVMAAYVQWFEQDEQYRPDLALLLLVGLFDRPAPVEALDALLADPALDALTHPLRASTPEQQTRALRHLVSLDLLTENRATGLSDLPTHLPGLEGLESLDAHPLVREFFGEKLRREQPDAWRLAHAVLYDYHRGLPEKLYGKYLPDTLEEMEPLFAAVMHGCLAGKWQEVLEEVYWERISRKKEGYSINQLGAFGSDLTALAWFFERLWDRPAQVFTEDLQAFILSFAGYGLRALGRLSEATQPMKVALKRRINEENWKSAAANASNLSELYLIAGEVTEATTYGQRSIEYADQSGDNFYKESFRATYADALHAAGQVAAARQRFAEAEIMQQERQLDYRYLYSKRGFQYRDLLLGSGQYEEVLERAKFALEISTRNHWLLHIALDHLTLGKAHYHLFQKQSLNTHRQAAQGYLDEAVEELQNAGRQDYTPFGFLARAAFHRHLQAYALAEADLQEAYEIASAGGMRLHLTDYHLEMARLRLAQERPVEAREEWEKARQLVVETGYHRRDEEVEALREALELNQDGMGF